MQWELLSEDDSWGRWVSDAGYSIQKFTYRPTPGERVSGNRSRVEPYYRVYCSGFSLDHGTDYTLLSDAMRACAYHHGEV